MARDLHRRIQRLERLNPYRDETDPHTLRLLAQLTRRMWKLTPELALVEACDTDRDTWRSIQGDGALMRGDWEEAARLGAAPGHRDRSRRVPMDEAMREIAAMGPRAEAVCGARSAAIEAAKRRLANASGIPHGDPSPGDGNGAHRE